MSSWGHRLKFGGGAGIGRSTPDICRERPSWKATAGAEGIAAKGVGSPETVQAILDAQRVILGAVIAQQLVDIAPCGYWREVSPRASPAPPAVRSVSI